MTVISIIGDENFPGKNNKLRSAWKSGNNFLEGLMQLRPNYVKVLATHGTPLEFVKIAAAANVNYEVVFPSTTFESPYTDHDMSLIRDSAEMHLKNNTRMNIRYLKGNGQETKIDSLVDWPEQMQSSLEYIIKDSELLVLLVSKRKKSPLITYILGELKGRIKVMFLYYDMY